eukprot:scaffold216770_cov46-Prasinocladus_malaysianus.AAC.1
MESEPRALPCSVVEFFCEEFFSPSSTESPLAEAPLFVFDPERVLAPSLSDLGDCTLLVFCFLLELQGQSLAVSLPDPADPSADDPPGFGWRCCCPT